MVPTSVVLAATLSDQPHDDEADNQGLPKHETYKTRRSRQGEQSGNLAECRADGGFHGRTLKRSAYDRVQSSLFNADWPQSWPMDYLYLLLIPFGIFWLWL